MKVANLLFSGSMANALRRPVDPKTETRRVARPRWAAGDVLYVRETCRGEELPDSQDGVRYASDNQFLPIENSVAGSMRWLKLHTYNNHARHRIGPWVPSIHMPRWASRTTLRVIEVRQEPLNDISEEGALAEGVVYDPEKGFLVPGVAHPNPDFPYLSRSTARQMYAALWDTINGSGAWLGNPLVWVTRFERPVLENVDHYLKRSGLAA